VSLKTRGAGIVASEKGGPMNNFEMRNRHKKKRKSGPRK
jgi:hypothetical protein